MVEHDVTEVDDFIEVAPRCIAIGGQQVDGRDIVECVVYDVGELHQLVRAVAAPDDGTLHDVVVQHGLVASVHHLVHVALGLPEVISHDAVCGVDGEEVIAAGKGHCACNDVAAKQTGSKVFSYLSSHNNDISLIAFHYSLFTYQNPTWMFIVTDLERGVCSQS